MKSAIVIAIVVGALGVASAGPNLTLDHEPMPTSMRMRPKRAAQTSSVRPQPAPKVVPAIVTPPPALPIRTNDLGGVRDVQQPVSFTLNVGYQVEATQLTDRSVLGGESATMNGTSSFSRIRSYGFGEGFLATRGVGVANLSTYFALRFQAARDLEKVTDPTSGDLQKPPPIATWFERSGTELRTGWLEVKDFLPERYGVKGLRVRAGDFFVYGPWIMHVDGALAAWETKIIKFQAYISARHSDYARDVRDDRATVLGGSARIDLRDLVTPVPIAVAVEAMNVGPDASAHANGSRNLQAEIDWRPKTDFALIGKVRRLDGETANERLEFRGRYRQVSNLVFDVIHRHRTDWRWDPTLGRLDAADDTLTARRYLDLGPVLPQLVASVRGGTLIAENFDVSLRGAFARDLGQENEQTTYNSSYVEGAAAVQARLRRTIALDLSVLSRVNSLEKPIPIKDGIAAIPAQDPTRCDESTLGPDGPTACQPLPAIGAMGETSFTEIGAALRMTLGARRFNAAVEIYGRKTNYAHLYEVRANTNEEDYQSDIRGGGRFTVDAWVGEKVRLYAAYDLSSRFEFAPEITGYKSLRLIMAGTY